MAPLPQTSPSITCALPRCMHVSAEPATASATLALERALMSNGSCCWFECGFLRMPSAPLSPPPLYSTVTDLHFFDGVVKTSAKIQENRERVRERVRQGFLSRHAGSSQSPFRRRARSLCSPSRHPNLPVSPPPREPHPLEPRDGGRERQRRRGKGGGGVRVSVYSGIHFSSFMVHNDTIGRA